MIVDGDDDVEVIPTTVTLAQQPRHGTVEVNVDGTVTYNVMTSIVNQTGGILRTTGYSGDPKSFPGEYDALHFAHWPKARSFYNISGGQLIIGKITPQ